jgi:outer membrane protein assembly factor BamB
LGKPAWRLALGKTLEANVESDRAVIERQPRIGESWNGILAYFPIISDGRVFVAHTKGVSAVDAATGRPAWGEAGTAASGEAISAADALVFRDDDFIAPKTNQWTRGVPRFTLSLSNERLIARVGPPATSLPTESRAVPATAKSKIVVLDVSPAGQGRLAFDPIELDDELLAFDGTPVSDGRRLYAVLRRSDVRPEVLVACYDLDANPPRERWRTSVAAAETPGSGQVYELTHNLLALDGDTLYLNANLGAVAAIATDDGSIRWLHAYPRVKLGDLRRLGDTGHFYRDLTPCLVHHDALVVAPFDSPAIFALDAATGAMRWSTDAAPDAIHVLGVAGETLWASGDRLYAFDVRTGRLRGRWPEAVKADPRGFGRGVIVGDAVLWPTRHELFVFDAKPSGSARSLAERQPPLVWSRLGAAAGNLAWSQGMLVVTTENEMIAFRLDAGDRGR